LSDHDAGGRLACKERSLEIDGDRQVEVLFAHVLGEVVRRDSGIVDEDIETAESGDDLVHGLSNLVRARHIHLQRQSLSAKRLDFLDQMAVAVHVAQSNP